MATDNTLFRRHRKTVFSRRNAFVGTRRYRIAQQCTEITRPPKCSRSLATKTIDLFIFCFLFSKTSRALLNAMFVIKTVQIFITSLSESQIQRSYYVWLIDMVTVLVIFTVRLVWLWINRNPSLFTLICVWSSSV